MYEQMKEAVPIGTLHTEKPSELSFRSPIERPARRVLALIMLT